MDLEAFNSDGLISFDNIEPRIDENGEKICAWCDREYHAKGLCHTHYVRIIRYEWSVAKAKRIPIQNHKLADQCKWCDSNDVIAKDLCELHYRRIVQLGWTEEKAKNRSKYFRYKDEVCEWCERLIHADGLCDRHYRRVAEFGWDEETARDLPMQSRNWLDFSNIPNCVFRSEGVYFCQEIGSDYYKIGYSTNTKNRLYDIQLGNPRRISFRAFIASDKPLENRIHCELNDYHIRGEWFFVSKENLNSIVESYNGVLL